MRNKNKDDNQGKKGKNFLVWIVIFFFVMTISSFFNQGPKMGVKEIAFSDFMSSVEAGAVEKVEIKGQDLNGILKSSERFYTFLPNYPNLVEKLREKNVQVNAVPVVGKYERIIGGLLGWLPFIIIIGLWIFLMKGAAGGGKALGFGKSKAKLLQENKLPVTFKDVAGIDEAKEELVEIVDFLKSPEKIHCFGS